MPPFRVTRLVDFAALAGDWLVVSRSIGPAGDLGVLLSDLPHPCPRWWSEACPDATYEALVGARYRLLSLPDGTDRGRVVEVSLPPDADRPLTVVPFGNGRWLAFDYGGTARVFDGAGRIVADWGVVDYPESVHAIEDCAWVAYRGDTDAIINGCAPSKFAAVRRLDPGGELATVIPSATVPTVPEPHWINGLNAVSASAAWVAYTRLEAPADGTWSSSLVRLVAGRIAGAWPWSVVRDKAPVTHPGAFAVMERNLLLQGHSDSEFRLVPPHEPPNRDEDRLYLVALEDRWSVELVPVDEQGDWIGEFEAREGRRGMLYLDTERYLYAADIRGAFGDRS